MPSTWSLFGKMSLSRLVPPFRTLLRSFYPIPQAPHHSRASWMKFWRRHKHELSRSEGDEPLPAPPDKKMRYSKEDDILLAKHFFNKPEGTSDKIFQAFGRLVRWIFISRSHVASFERFPHRLTVFFSSCSIHIIRGRDGKNIIGYIKQRLSISWGS